MQDRKQQIFEKNIIRRYILSKKEIFKQLIFKLEFMYNFNFAHRDIKPANILIYKNKADKYFFLSYQNNKFNNKNRYELNSQIM